jgi:Xaa-Pro aminopeptidase
MEGAEKKLLGFDTLTFAPIDRNLVEVGLLTEAERRWLNDYHTQVLEVVAPQLEGEVLAWAREACAPI